METRRAAKTPFLIYFNNMSYVIAGLGNPGERYENTRHNAGRVIAEQFRAAEAFPEWKEEKKLRALVSAGKAGKENITIILPDNFMNNSGKSLTTIVKGKKGAEQLVVIYDDLDLPLGSFKISFNRGSGGHKGLESVIRMLKTKAFIRVRVGIAPVTPSGKTKIVRGEEQVLKLILGAFKDDELKKLKQTGKKICEALRAVVTEGKDYAMNHFN